MTEVAFQTIAAPWVLPNEWEWVELGSLCEVQIGATPNRSDSRLWGGGHTWLSISDLNGGVVSTSAEQITDDGVQMSSVKLVQPGTVLMSFKLTIGKLAIAGKPLYTNEAIAALPIRAEWQRRLDRDFLFAALRAIPLSGTADFAVKGRTLNKAKIRRLSIPIPFPDDAERALQVQRQITSVLRAVDESIEKCRSAIEEIDREREFVLRAAVDEAFSSTTMARWPFASPLADLVDIDAHLVSPLAEQYRDLPHIGVDAIESGCARLGSYRTAREDEVISGKYLFTPGEVLYGKIRPYLRKSAVVKFPGLCSADVYPLRVKSDELNADFLSWALLAPPFVEYTAAVSGRARMPKINQKDLFAFEFRYPSVRDQFDIAKRLRNVEERTRAIASVLRSHADLLHAVERAVLASLFRGDIPASAV